MSLELPDNSEAPKVTTPTTETPGSGQPTPTDEAKIPAAGTPEYDAYMAEIGRKHEEQFKPQKPEGIPDKFWDAAKGEVRVEAMAKSYSELEKKLGGPKKTEEQAPSDETTTEQKPAEQTDGSDPFAKYTAEFTEKGDLTPESYAELESKGFPKRFVEAYIAGQKAQVELQSVKADSYVNDIKNSVGGSQVFDAMAKWAGANLSAEDKTLYQSQLGNPESAKLAVQWLKSKYDAANGSAPSLLQGTGAPAATTGFASEAEIIAAVSDPRYTKDPAYRAGVEQKLSKTRL